MTALLTLAASHPLLFALAVWFAGAVVAARS
jgi:hypothetical protein